jgi:hypothetical protein
MAMDESPDVSDTAQLGVFVRRIDMEFSVTGIVYLNGNERDHCRCRFI